MIDPKRLIFGRPWLLSESYLSDLKTAAALVDFAKLAPSNATPDSYDVRNGVAVIEVDGILMKSPSILDLLFGQVAIIGEIQNQFDAALADDSVRVIVFHFDSPGGSVSGVPELATHIFEAKGKSTKVVGGVGDGLLCSGAYWLASACDFLAITEATMAGSIGCIAAFADSDRAMKNAGFDPLYFRSSPMKGAGGDGYQEIHGRDLQAQVNRYGSMFIDAALRRGRGFSDAQIEALGDPAACWIGSDAVALNLADEVATLDSVVSRYAAQ